MSTPKTYDPSTKRKLILPHMRGAVKAGEAPLYVLNAPDYDRVPLLTFLVETMMGTGGLVPTRAMRIVKPNHPEQYPLDKLTQDKRLLYCFWLRENTTARQVARAVRMLAEPKRNTYRHVIMPGEDGYELLDAFKIACDIRKAGADHHIKPDLMLRALGIEAEAREMFPVYAFT